MGRKLDGADRRVTRKEVCYLGVGESEGRSNSRGQNEVNGGKVTGTDKRVVMRKMLNEIGRKLGIADRGVTIKEFFLSGCTGD